MKEPVHLRSEFRYICSFIVCLVRRIVFGPCGSLVDKRLLCKPHYYCQWRKRNWTPTTFTSLSSKSRARGPVPPADEIPTGFYIGAHNSCWAGARKRSTKSPNICQQTHSSSQQSESENSRESRARRARPGKTGTALKTGLT